MAEIILHHYPLSPYSEKIRAALGYKQLHWHSVETPIMLPKPDLQSLTGGYRRAPVLQLGRDIYCDSRLILRVLDRLQPDPPLFPAEVRASCAAFASLEQTLFFAAVATVFQPAGLRALMDSLGAETMEKFARDRSALFSGGTASRPTPEFGKIYYLPLLYALDQQLAASPFLLGDAPTAADFAMYHPIWFVLNNAGVAASVEPFYNVMTWVGEMRKFGDGSHDEISAAAALGIARTAPNSQDYFGPVLEPDGVQLGMRVKVNATDYGTDPIIGTLVHASVFEFAVRRSDPRSGEVIVHVPRTGFAAAPAGGE